MRCAVVVLTLGFLTFSWNLSHAVEAAQAPRSAQQDCKKQQLSADTTSWKKEKEEVDARSGATLCVTVAGAGVIAVVVRANVDVFLTVADSLGQVLPEGQTDTDLFSDPGAEQALVTVPAGGNYQIRVKSFSGTGSFDLVAWFHELELVASENPNGTPAEARELELDRDAEESLDSRAGDFWDWWEYKNTTDGAQRITIQVVANDPANEDLVLDGTVTSGGVPEDVSVLSEYADNDDFGDLGRESLNIELKSGETAYVRVRALANRAPNGLDYRIKVTKAAQ